MEAIERHGKPRSPLLYRPQIAAAPLERGGRQSRQAPKLERRGPPGPAGSPAAWARSGVPDLDKGTTMPASLKRSRCGTGLDRCRELGPRGPRPGPPSSREPCPHPARHTGAGTPTPTRRHNRKRTAAAENDHRKSQVNPIGQPIENTHPGRPALFRYPMANDRLYSCLVFAR
jgi:hypothetical protein